MAPKKPLIVNGGKTLKKQEALLTDNSISVRVVYEKTTSRTFCHLTATRSPTLLPKTREHGNTYHLISIPASIVGALVAILFCFGTLLTHNRAGATIFCCHGAR